MKPKPDHPQVPFTTVHGKKTEVDEELLDILEALKRIGVVTLYSCQGDEKHHGYISALRPGMNRFLKIMFSISDDRRYSQEVREFIKGFKNGYKDVEFAIRFQDGTYQAWAWNFSKGYENPRGYQIERSWSNDHLPRIVIRWPHYQNETFLQLLQEMHA